MREMSRVPAVEFPGGGTLALEQAKAAAGFPA